MEFENTWGFTGYCEICGTLRVHKSPDGENKIRIVCPKCGKIAYSNPKVISGCVPFNNVDSVLLCRRNIEPRKGYWTIPAGYMELGESLSEAAVRETKEETGMVVSLDSIDPFLVCSAIYSDQVHVTFKGRAMNDPEESTSESSEIKWFNLYNIPWDDLAFDPVSLALKKLCLPNTYGGIYYSIRDPILSDV